MTTATEDGLHSARRTPTARSADVRSFYLIALNRTPESAEALHAYVGHDPRDLTAAFFTCAEFQQRVVRPLASGRRFYEVGDLSQDLRDWSARRLPLRAAGRDAVRSARSWADLYLALLTDPEFRAILGDDAEATKPSVIASLAQQSGLYSGIEDATPERVSGWIVRESREEPATVEVMVNGYFVAAGRADLFRRDIQDRLGGDGLFGFDIGLPADYDDGRGRLSVEVREAATGLVLGERQIERSGASLDALGAVHAELVRVRTLLDELDLRLPWIATELSTPLSDYGEYHRRWYRDGGPAPDTVMAVAVWIDGANAPADWVEESVQSVCRQTHDVLQIILSTEPQQALAARDLAQRIEWTGGRARLDVRVEEERSPAIRLRTALAGMAPDVEVVLVMDATTVLAADAIACFANRLSADAACGAVYADEDRFLPDDADRFVQDRRHHDPVLRPGFDRDMLMQTPYVGASIAFRRSSLVGLQPNADAGFVHAANDVLEISGKGGRVTHVPRVLATCHQRAGPADQTWKACVAAHLAGANGVRVETASLGLAGAVRVRRDVPDGVRATIVIPTRDSLDLLKGCFDSLIRHRADNRAIMDIVVVDHLSEQPDTLNWLAARRDAGDLRVLPIKAAFNWALINNLAAQQSDADVLVFLNNDTVVVTPDWLDELVSQTLRPEVGVVGCRLLYADGTIQHAGFVTRDSEDAFLVHEGVGRPASDIGYLGRHVLLREAAAVTGACMAVRAEVFRALGGFDASSFAVEGNDVDLCFRARAAGFKVLYDPWATLYHLESKTRGFSFDGARRKVAEAASRRMWHRWGERFGRDAGFNAHFDRLSKPFERLRPPGRGG